jgi:hypothetical protein
MHEHAAEPRTEPEMLVHRSGYTHGSPAVCCMPVRLRDLVIDQGEVLDMLADREGPRLSRHED